MTEAVGFTRQRVASAGQTSSPQPTGDADGGLRWVLDSRLTATGHRPASGGSKLTAERGHSLWRVHTPSRRQDSSEPVSHSPAPAVDPRGRRNRNQVVGSPPGEHLPPSTELCVTRAARRDDLASRASSLGRDRYLSSWRSYPALSCVCCLKRQKQDPEIKVGDWTREAQPVFSTVQSFLRDEVTELSTTEDARADNEPETVREIDYNTTATRYASYYESASLRSEGGLQSSVP
ncbi:hypothetical protein ON010_g17832 [Phytophthora cinnamomi]|nr:hypothetical protein ON010_g17832 [Phytophthora cinnamomi]